jgi:nanoRNase/pAp phosphatase (c-di-AMP/oligoRNAs hydrolase)
MHNVLITCHTNGDFDAISSMICANLISKKKWPDSNIVILWPGTSDHVVQNIVINDIAKELSTSSKKICVSS